MPRNREECRNWDDYDEGPCSCSECADYDPAQSIDSSEQELSADSESSGVEQQTSPRKRRTSARIPTETGEFSSSADLQKLLHERYPEEYAAMLERSHFTFENWKGSKRLRIGEIRTPFSAGRIVYASIGGAGKNRLSLTQGPKHKTIHLCDTHVIELDQPFRDLCHNGRFFYVDEDMRLRAMMCFWFVNAGFVDTFKKYRDFEKHLVDGCRWIGKAALTKASSNRESDSNKASPANDQPLTRQSGPSESESSRNPSKRSANSFQELEQRPRTNMTNKRAKLEDVVADMQRRNIKQAENLNVIQQELTQMKADGEYSTEAKREIFEKDQELKKIKDENQALKQSFDGERLLKLQAEEKLSNYIDAQKKMAAQYL